MLRDVGDPQLVRPEPVELAVDEIAGGRDAAQPFHPCRAGWPVDAGLVIGTATTRGQNWGLLQDPLTLAKWVRQDEIVRGPRPGTSSAESAELRTARRRITELERELTIPARYRTKVRFRA